MKRKSMLLLTALALVLTLALAASALAAADTEQYFIRASAGDGGKIEPRGEIRCSKGSNAAFRIIPNKGYEIADVLVAEVIDDKNQEFQSDIGGLDTNTNTYTFKDVQKYYHIKAVFAEAEYSITVEGGTADKSEAKAGETVSIKADTAEEGMMFGMWTAVKPEQPSIEFADKYAESTDFVMPADDVEIKAEFTPVPEKKYNITVVGGKADKSEAKAGETVSITAGAAEEGMMFETWTAVKPDQQSIRFRNKHVESTDFVMPAGNVEIKAEFSKKYIIILKSKPGFYEISPSGEIPATKGKMICFTITPAEGYYIYDAYCLKINPRSTTFPLTRDVAGVYSFTMVASDVEVMVDCIDVDNVITIMANAGPGGTISPSGTITVKRGVHASFTIIPSKGYKIASILVDNEAISISEGDAYTGMSYTFKDLKKNHTITAWFEKIGSSAGEEVISETFVSAQDLLAVMQTVKENAGHFVKDLKAINPILTKNMVYQSGTKLIVNLNKLEGGIKLSKDMNYDALENSGINEMEIQKKKVAVAISIETLKEERPANVDVKVGDSSMAVSSDSISFVIPSENLKASVEGVHKVASVSIPVKNLVEYDVGGKIVHAQAKGDVECTVTINGSIIHPGETVQILQIGKIEKE